VFSTLFTTRALLFFTVFALSAASIWLSGALALRYASGPPRAPPLRGAQSSPGLLGYASTHIPWRWLVAGAAVLLGLLLAAMELSNWETVLRFLYQVPYGESDPVYGHDFSFYLFSLPLYVALKTWLLGLLILSAALAGVVYWVHGDIELDQQRRHL